MSITSRFSPAADERNRLGRELHDVLAHTLGALSIQLTAMLAPYPPGIPAALPGERLTDDVLRYLRTGVEAGMVVPDAANTDVTTIRVSAENP